jgi:hypothetical protein
MPLLLLLAGTLPPASRTQPVAHTQTKGGRIMPPPAPQAPPAPCSTCGGPEDKPHTLAASYYSVRDGLTATLLLNNKGPKPLEVKPTLFSLGGQRRELPPVTVQGLSYREIDMREFGVEGTDFEQATCISNAGMPANA